MGCASSTVSPGQDKQANRLNTQTDIPKVKQHDSTNNHSHRNVKSAKSKVPSLNLKNEQIDKNGNKLSSLEQTPVPKSVAFDVTFDGQIGNGLKSVKKRPPRLQALEPLNVPKLTAEQLQEKQRLADEKREKLKQRKINTSQKSSRRMRELQKAREFELSHLTKQDNAKHKPEEDAEIEKDEEFNNTCDDTWLGIPDKTDIEEEHGLQKRAGQMRQTVSSTTIDSYDAAFMRNTPERQNVPSVHNQQNNVNTPERQMLQPVHNLQNNVNTPERQMLQPVHKLQNNVNTPERQMLQPVHNLQNNVHIMDDFFDS